MLLLNHTPRLDEEAPLNDALPLATFNTLLPDQYNPVALLDVPETVRPPEKFNALLVNSMPILLVDVPDNVMGPDALMVLDVLLLNPFPLLDVPLNVKLAPPRLFSVRVLEFCNKPLPPLGVEPVNAKVPELAVMVLLLTKYTALRLLAEEVMVPVMLRGPLLVMDALSRSTVADPETTVPPPMPAKLTLPVVVNAPLMCRPLAKLTPLVPVEVPVMAIDPVPAFKFTVPSMVMA